MIKRSLLSALALAAVLVATGVFAGVGAGSDNSGNSVAGTWSVTVNRPAPLPPLTSLQVFTSDGSWIEMATEDPKTRTSQFGSWERIEGRLYAASGVIFRYDAQGAHVATMKINRNMRLSQDGQSMTVAARATLYDLNGNVLQAFPVVASGVRLPVERIPDEP